MSDTIPHGPDGIQKAGHRQYVGGKWSEIGRMQMAFLVGAGLRPAHVLVDIGCGSLRAGVNLIPYLDPSNYIGVEQHKHLVVAGIDKELGREVYQQQGPQFIFDADFGFDQMHAPPSFAWAQSVFTHLTRGMVEKCLSRLRPEVAEPHDFYATFWLTEDPSRPDESHDGRAFPYSEDEVHAIAEATGWRATVIGEWGHPRGQEMVRFRPA
jgi:hypothetical protein